MCVLWLMDIDGVILKVNITLLEAQLPACRKYLQQQLGEICLTIREMYEKKWKQINI